MAQPSSVVRYHQVLADEAGQRIDNFLLRHLKGLPRSRVYRLLRRGEVRVDGGRARPTRRLQAGEVVRIPPVSNLPSPTTPTTLPASLAEALQGGVLYEDDRLLVLNKPSGVAVHGGSTVRIGLIEALRLARPDLHYVELAHRLDQETSGCLLLAKRRSTLRRLHEQLREGEVDKRYTALLIGHLEHDRYSVDAPLERLPGCHHERQVRVAEGGRKALTHFTVTQRYTLGTSVAIRLATGRTHQIRVHARHIGYPVAGDSRYGERRNNAALQRLGLKRLFLHAAAVTLNHPDNGESVTVEAPLGADLEAVLAALDRVCHPFV